MAAFFVSYAKADQPWAEWIAHALEAHGFPCLIQAWDFRPGSNFVIEMQEAARKAERTIIVLSPAYLRATFTTPEWAAAFANDPQGLQRKLVPVRVEDCKPEGLLKSIVYIDLVGLDEAAARAALLRGVVPGRVKPETVPFPSSGRPPAHSPHFPGAASTRPSETTNARAADPVINLPPISTRGPASPNHLYGSGETMKNRTDAFLRGL